MAKSPIRPTDDEARAIARGLLAQVRHAALAVKHPETGAPHVTRIALAQTDNGDLITLISTLALHTTALMADPVCSILIGDPPAKGDPLAFPRITVAATARFIARDDDTAMRAGFLQTHPKARLYSDFADFGFVQFNPLAADLNGGFGKAYRLAPDDLI